jgi:hypothetical protein
LSFVDGLDPGGEGEPAIDNETSKQKQGKGEDDDKGGHHPFLVSEAASEPARASHPLTLRNLSMGDTARLATVSVTGSLRPVRSARSTAQETVTATEPPGAKLAVSTVTARWAHVMCWELSAVAAVCCALARRGGLRAAGDRRRPGGLGGDADVLAAMPASGTPRATVGRGLRSIFTTLKERKLIFANPTARVRIGPFERRIPLPASLDVLREALDGDDASRAALAALAALVAFHGLRPLELRDLLLTDVHDGRIHLPDRAVPIADPVQERLRRFLVYRRERWPNSANPHFFIHYLNASTTGPVSRSWVNRRLGLSAQAIRQDHMVDEAIATGGDVRRICDFFGVTIATAVHYAAVVDRPGLRGGEKASM